MIQVNLTKTSTVSQRILRFDRSKLPPARGFYEREGFKLGRANSKGWAMAQGQPPCHKSESGKSFSVNLDSGGFFCHGCKANGGDVVAYVQLRDRVDFKTAAQRLGAWDEVPPETVRKVAEQDGERDRLRQAEADRQAEERRRRLALRDQVHTAARIWKEACARLSELRRGAVPVTEDEEEKCWAVMSLSFKDLHDTEAEYCAAAGVEYAE